MSDVAFVAALSLIATFWAYLIYRNVRLGQFRKYGKSGWFEKAEDPGGASFALALDSLYFMILLLVIIWTILGKPTT